MSAVGDAVAHENKSAGRSAAWSVICFGHLHEESPSVGMGKRPLICLCIEELALRRCASDAGFVQRDLGGLKKLLEK